MNQLHFIQITFYAKNIDIYEITPYQETINLPDYYNFVND